MKNKMFNGKKMTRLVSILAALTLCALLVIPAAAYPAHTDYISDEATVLDEQTESTVRELSEKLTESKNVRIAVCTVLSTGDESAATYASELFKTWEVGHGVLVLLVIEDDTFYAVQSNSIAEILTSQKLSDIINSTIEPSFAEKDYAGGVTAAANVLSTFMTENLPDDLGEDGGGIPGWLSVILKIILVIAIILLAGYALLVYFERKRALRRRAELEERRRRMAREGRGAYPPRSGGAYPDPRRRPSAGQAQGRPVSRGNARPGQMMDRTGQFDPAHQRRRPSPMGYDDSAATVQINTADIRAARRGNRQ